MNSIHSYLIILCSIPVRVKPRSDILTEIIRDGKQHPKGWSATFGQDTDAFSHDCYIFHPDSGIYLLKEYHKNPFEVKGVGSKLARHLDSDIEEQITAASGGFGIIQGNFQKIMASLNKGISPKHILENAIQGKDLGIKIPVLGHASTSEDTFHSLNNTFSSQQKKLNISMKKMVTEDGLYSSYD